ncbi:hypothetical protein F4806DRAFT_375667 [Annulohypoxylon nitens]|nr:hypothetical protein F4806DRAFT_375667 [Annulohypoxylon nitens]
MMDLIEQEEKIPFMAFENSHHDQEVRSKKGCFLRNKHPILYGVLLVLQLLLFILNATLLISNATSLGNFNSNTTPEWILSPAETALQHITIEDLNYEHSSSPYTGEPRPELDQAWSKLLRSTLLRITKEEMVKMNKTSISLVDGSGYVGYIEALHMLHCVKRIYQSHHQEHYPEQQQDGAFTTPHLYHCLDVLREGIMCNADVTMNTLFWESPSRVLGERGPRKCTDWNRLQAWADDRTITAKDRETLLTTMVVPIDEIGSIGPIDLLR